MEEKIIIKGKFSKSNIFVIISIVSAIICFIISWSVYTSSGSTDWTGCYKIPYVNYITNPLDCPEGIGVCFYLAVLFILITIFFILEMNLCELTVSDKRVCGKTSFGRRVDLPLDKISSIGMCVPKGIIVATSSGAIKFWLLKNREDVYTAISNLVNDRQQNVQPRVMNNTGNSNNTADELKKYKELLDSGIISQEEFDAKKKQLLGL